MSRTRGTPALSLLPSPLSLSPFADPVNWRKCKLTFQRAATRFSSSRSGSSVFFSASARRRVFAQHTRAHPRAPTRVRSEKYFFPARLSCARRRRRRRDARLRSGIFNRGVSLSCVPRVFARQARKERLLGLLLLFYQSCKHRARAGGRARGRARLDTLPF